MHEEAEHGVAAHWVYKENKANLSGYEEKIAFLRHLLAWHKELTTQENQPENTFEDRIYTLTPAGDIIELRQGATPLDFAYHIHSEVGHHCRGAKVNNRIVPLTYSLQTGDTIEIITHPKATPSRDWINPASGYLKTIRAREKVAQWFNQQQILEAKQRQAIETELPRPLSDEQKSITKLKKPSSIQRNSITSGLEIAGIRDLLTRIAKCCKPLPGDSIIGFITQGRGVSIHRQDCNNVTNSATNHRFIQVTWDQAQSYAYYVDIKLIALNRNDLLRDITALLANAKIDLINFSSIINKKNNVQTIILTMELHDVVELQHVTQQLQQLPHVIQVKRISE